MRIGLSFEFFPPNTEAGEHKLRAVRRSLATLRPDFFSVTFGAGGATRDKTSALVQAISREAAGVHADTAPAGWQDAAGQQAGDPQGAIHPGAKHAAAPAVAVQKPDRVQVPDQVQVSARVQVSDRIPSPVPVAPHISCIGQDREQLAALLAHYRAMGVERIVALRGDLPSGMVQGGTFRYAEDLVGFIRERHGEHFQVMVAAYPEMHPQAASPQADLRAFVRKVRKGASLAITQYFFNADAYFRFRDEVAREGLAIEIVPGIMPITNTTQLLRFSESCGAEIPRWIRLKLASFGDDRDAIRSFGREVVAMLCRRLIEGGVRNLHFYTLNQSEPSMQIVSDLALAP